MTQKANNTLRIAISSVIVFYFLQGITAYKYVSWQCLLEPSKTVLLNPPLIDLSTGTSISNIQNSLESLNEFIEDDLIIEHESSNLIKVWFSLLKKIPNQFIYSLGQNVISIRAPPYFKS